MKKAFLAIALTGILASAKAQEGDSLRNYELEEIMISTSRANTRLKNMPQKIEIIDRNEIQSIPSGNLATLLKRKTNLDIVQYPGLSSSIGMRGFSPTAHARSYTLLLIDGKPSGTTNLTTINTEQIERIEIVKGPYSVLYGSDAMGGVINVITAGGNRDNLGSVSFSGGNFGTLKYNAEIGARVGGSSSFQVGFSRNERIRDYRIGTRNLLELSEKERLIQDEASYGDTMQNSRMRINHVNAGFESSLNSGWKIGAKALYTEGNRIGVPGNYWGSYGQTIKDINRINLIGTLEHKGERSTFMFSPYFSSENNPNYNNDSDTGFVNFVSHVKEYGFKSHDHISVGDLKILAGADLDIYDYDSERYSTAATPASPYVPGNRNVKSALFAQVSYARSGFRANAGTRLNHISYRIEQVESLSGTGGKQGYLTLNPSAGIQYTLPAGVKIHGSYGRAFSVPDAFKVAGFYQVSEYFPAWDFWWIQSYTGNPELKPEVSHTTDLGIRFSSTSSPVSLDATWFSTWHNNKIVEYRVGGDTLSFRNANQSRMGGIELLGTLDVGKLVSGSFKLELYANFTHMFRSEVDETLFGSMGQDSLVTRQMLYTRRDNGNFGILFDTYKGFTTRLHARYIGSRLELDNFSYLRPGITPEDYYTQGGYTTAEGILELPDHLVFDYSVHYTFLGSIRMGITVSNLFDENYSEKDGYHMPGRMILGSIQYSF